MKLRQKIEKTWDTNFFNFLFQTFENAMEMGGGGRKDTQYNASEITK